MYKATVIILLVAIFTVATICVPPKASVKELSVSSFTDSHGVEKIYYQYAYNGLGTYVMLESWQLEEFREYLGVNNAR